MLAPHNRRFATVTAFLWNVMDVEVTSVPLGT